MISMDFRCKFYLLISFSQRIFLERYIFKNTVSEMSFIM